MGVKLKTWVVLGLLLGTMAYAMATDYVAWEIYPSPTGNYYDLRVANSLTVGDEATDQATFNATTVKAPNGLLVLTGVPPTYPSLSLNGTTGRVGIGIIAPSTMLHVVDTSSANPAVQIEDQSAALVIRDIASNGQPDRYWRIGADGSGSTPGFFTLDVSNSPGFPFPGTITPLAIFPNAGATGANILMDNALLGVQGANARVDAIVPNQHVVGLGGDPLVARVEFRQTAPASFATGPYIDFAAGLPIDPANQQPVLSPDFHMRIQLEANNVLAILPGTLAGGTLRLPNLLTDPTVTPNAPGALYYNSNSNSTRVLRSTGWTNIVSVGGLPLPPSAIPPCAQTSCTTPLSCAIPPAPSVPGFPLSQVWDVCFLRGAELAERNGACVVEPWPVSTGSGWRIRAGNASSCGSGTPQVSTCYAVCLKF